MITPMNDATRPQRYRVDDLTGLLPHGGMRSALPGGNTVGGWIRESTARADGYRHVDTPATIAMLQEIGANHYFFGIWDSPTDWDDLRLEFAPAAQQAGIQVLPYIVPPTETFDWGRASRPYLLDFEAWAREFATLSLSYPALTGWAIDDFDVGDNATVFTADYLSRIRQAQQAINPQLAFFTCAYYESATSPEFLSRYAPFIDGIIYPFLDGPNVNTLVADSAPADIAAVTSAAADHDLAVIFLVYAGRFLDGVSAPHQDYVGTAVRYALEATARGEILGVVAYGLQVDGAPTIANERRSMYGDGRGSIASSHRPMPAGTWAELSCRVEVDPSSARHELSFWWSKIIELWRTPDRGDFVLQVLLDGALVWRADLHDATWLGLWAQGHSEQGQFDVSAALLGKSGATLSFRVTALRDVKDSSFDLGLDNLEAIGLTIPDPGFEDRTAWRTASSGGPIVARVDVFDDDRPARILDAVTAEYTKPNDV
ncbi:hypothetical protein SAMN04489812_4908 [Microlunatus soli]|uniref:Uncharacterized protein n=2 Tax=Microlunatus soli TaxID=630515 RepID=A0A1H1Z0W1_9ACTN|nr:hypothetical protein SAMN04489812_4908 [Microlunatus soli]